jgi:hypothetical protein
LLSEVMEGDGEDLAPIEEEEEKTPTTKNGTEKTTIEGPDTPLERQSLLFV